MAANNVQAALTEIPLSLEQAADPEIKAAKIKSNSLKRFFKTSKASSMPASKSDIATSSTSQTKKTPLLFRFASFSKSDGLDTPIDDKEPDPSTSKPGATRSHWSLSSSWTLPFRKSSKKSPTNEEESVDVVPQINVEEVHHQN